MKRNKKTTFFTSTSMQRKYSKKVFYYFLQCFNRQPNITVELAFATAAGKPTGNCFEC